MATMLGTVVFQFHLVRLKEKEAGNLEYSPTFQFHLVRLKV